MAFSVQMPALGESVTEGTVTRWLKQEGDTVEVDEPLVEVSTDKVDTEIPSPAAGVLTKIVAQEDDTVEVGGELAIIGDSAEGGSGSSEPAPAAGQPEPQAEAEPRAEAEPQAEAPPEPKPQAAPEPAAPAQQQSGGGSGDTTPVLMPELGESVAEGTVTRWLKKVGDSVQVDDPLVEVSTDKVDTEIPSPVAGVLVSITAQEDDIVAVGGELARIGAGAESGGSPTPQPEPKPEPKTEPKPEPRPQAEAKPEPKPQPAPEPAPKPQPAPAQPAAEPSGSDGTPYVTPLVRKLAVENGIDLNEVTGTGVGGRIRKQDVLAAAEQKQRAQQAPAAAPTAPTAPT
ncbi:2-oxoglutarate dehydrogenase, E2 component, dihydrolipoamide succinyltransferase, partial [Mycobacterium saskatchewanense]